MLENGLKEIRLRNRVHQSGRSATSDCRNGLSFLITRMLLLNSAINLVPGVLLVGRLHKPSFLFFYLMAHLIDVKKETLAGEYLYEVKGGGMVPGVEGIAEKITKTLSMAK